MTARRHKDKQNAVPAVSDTRSMPLRRSSRLKRHESITVYEPFIGDEDEVSLDQNTSYEPVINHKKHQRPALVRRSSTGVSTKKFPPISETRFGLLQEKLWREPFWLLVAVTFLNKTAGRSAAPIFWKLKELYPTPIDLASADEQDLIALIHCLGLQTQRARRLIKLATAWSIEPPRKGQQHRTLHYPAKGDGRDKTADISDDPHRCIGSLEIGNIPGAGPYAWDSWRMFCRDVLRGVADDYNGLNSVDGFEPEWKRVIPLDKELRAYLRWMWLREGFVWNHETGHKRRVTEAERLQSVKGELEPVDTKEAQFTAQANEDVADMKNKSRHARPTHDTSTAGHGNKKRKRSLAS